MIARARPLIAALIVLFGCGLSAAAAPDLTISHLEMQPAQPMPGESVTLFAVIQNVGDSEAEDLFYVRFVIDGEEVDAISVPSGVGVGRSRTVSTVWSASPGAHVLEVDVDRPLDRVREQNETNNSELLPFVVPFSGEVTLEQESVRIVVAAFEDLTDSGFISVGEGTADALSERLAKSGVRVLDRAELESVMQTREYDPSSIADLSAAARELNADLVVRGTVENLQMTRASLFLGFFRVSSASVDVRVTAELIDPVSQRVMTSLAVQGANEGSTGFSVDLDVILGLSDTVGDCLPGFRSAQTWYSLGEPVSLRFMNHGAPVWYGVEIHSSTDTFIRWLGWKFIGTNECGAWHWDQRDSLGSQLGPGIYFAKLWDGTSFIDSVSFQIRPGVSVDDPSVDEITFGHAAFDETIVGTALSDAVDQLSGSLLPAIYSAPIRTAEEGERSADLMAMAPTAEAEWVGPLGQIASILPDGRIAINLGAADGIARGDFFEVIEASNVVVDPQSLDILSYDEIAYKGEVVVTEIRDRVSYCVPTVDFSPAIGDIVRALLP